MNGFEEEQSNMLPGDLSAEDAARAERWIEVPEVVRLNAREQKRAQVMANYAAGLASAETPVREMRVLLTGSWDGTIPPQQARLVLDSPATRRLDWQAFRDRDVRVAFHRAQILREDAMPRDTRKDQRLTLRIASLSGETLVAITSSNGGTGTRHNVPVSIPGVHGDPEVVPAWAGSVLAELGELAEWVANRYPCRSDEALWFVLTGSSRVFRPLRMGIRARHDQTPLRFVIEAEPWISAETIARSFRSAQHRLLGGRSRPVGDRLLALFEYIAGVQRGEHRPRWREMLDKWNDVHPAWRYDHVRNFAADANRAMALLVPSYGWPSQHEDVAGTTRGSEGD